MKNGQLSDPNQVTPATSEDRPQMGVVAARPGETDKRMEPAQSRQEPSGQGSIRILLVEDDRDNADMWQELLESREHTRFVVSNARRLADALLCLADKAHDVVLLDLNLPDSRGIDTLDAVHKAFPLIPVLVLSGLADKELATSVLRRGAQDYFVKAEVSDDVVARAITYAVERKHAEEALRESEERHRAILEQVSEAIFLVEPESNRFVDANPAFQKLVGYSLEELLGMQVYDVLPYDRERIDRAGVRALSEGHYRVSDRLYRRKDGSLVNVEVGITPVTYGGRQVLCEVVRDITERKQAEELLRERSEQLDEAQRLSQIGSWEWDIRSGELACSNEMSRIFSIDADHPGAIYEEYLKRIHPDDAEKLTEDMQRALTEKSSLDRIYRFIRPNGEIGYFHARSELVADQDGNVIKIRGTSQDITERMEAENALLKSESNYRFLVEHMSEGLLQVDADDVVQLVNDRYCEMVGYTREELIGKVAKDLVVVEEDHAIIAEKARLRSLDITDSYEVRMRKKSGEIIWVQIGGAPVKDAFGNVVGSIEIHTDITERKRTEEALQKSEERFQLVARATHDVIWDRDLVTGELWWSKGSDNKPNPMPRDSDTHNEETWYSRIHPEDRDTVKSTMASVLKGSGTYLSNEYRLLQDDGTYSHVLDRGYIIRNAEGQPVRMIGSVMDITERKLFEEALQESEERARAQYRGNPIPTYTWLRIGDEFVLNDYNLAAEEITEGGIHALLGKTATDMYQEMPSMLEDFERCYREQTTIRREMEYKFVSLDKTRHMAISFVYVPPDLVMVHTEDISERKQAEEVRLAMEATGRASAAKSEFLSRMSHELRTPLNAILGFSELLQIDGPSPEQKESVDYIVKAGKHLLTLINEVLDIARIEEGHMPLTVEPVLLEDVLREGLDLIKPMAAQRQITLSTSIPPAYPKRVIVDRHRIRQVLLNLLSNAVKYNRVGGKVTLSCESVPGDRVRLLVVDSGQGIRAEDLPKLFMPFERLNAGSSEVEGSGLGLALSKKLVEAMGGAIGVSSVVGQGSTFWVELAGANEYLQLSHYQPTGPLRDPGEARPPRTVLYIEDNISNMRLMESIIKHRPNVTLLPAIQGDIGLTMAQVHRPDLILLDLNLPDIPGETVLAQLRQDPATARIPVVVVSADATPPQMQRLLESGAYAYITKPINVTNFLKVLDESLEYEQELKTPC